MLRLVRATVGRSSCATTTPSVHRRTYSTKRDTVSDRTTRSILRALLRETAQPVAIVTGRLGQNARGNPNFHGATLSSFTSIAMDPHPLVAFSLRLPSRMATSLKDALLKTSGDAGMVVNILSASQAHAAAQFASPTLHPEPFSSVPFSLTQEGLPVLDGCLGAISCTPIACWPLHDLETLAGKSLGESVTSVEGGVENGGLLSELFVAKVLRVERTTMLAGESEATLDEHALPLVYHRREYATTRTLDPNPRAKR